MATSGSILGNAVLRKEDPGLLTGENKYSDDLAFPNTAAIVFVRSSVAHANLRRDRHQRGQEDAGRARRLHRSRSQPGR